MAPMGINCDMKDSQGLMTENCNSNEITGLQRQIRNLWGPTSYLLLKDGLISSPENVLRPLQYREISNSSSFDSFHHFSDFTAAFSSPLSHRHPPFEHHHELIISMGGDVARQGVGSSSSSSSSSITGTAYRFKRRGEATMAAGGEL